MLRWLWGFRALGLGFKGFGNLSGDLQVQVSVLWKVSMDGQGLAYVTSQQWIVDSIFASMLS